MTSYEIKQLGIGVFLRGCRHILLSHRTGVQYPALLPGDSKPPVNPAPGISPLTSEGAALAFVYTQTHTLKNDTF